MTQGEATPLTSDSGDHSPGQRANSPPLRPQKISRVDHADIEEDQKGLIISQNMNLNPRSQRYLVAIEYIGTRFAGAQQQPPNFRTVVGVLQEAFRKFIGQHVSVFCSSRTDAGVHALSNVCHVDIERISKRKPGEVLPPHDPAVVKKAVNHFLQKTEGDITVIDVRSVPPNFHSRYQARERTYFYRLLSGPEALSTFEKDRAWHVPAELDILAMQEACKVLVGQHDFSSFRAAACQAKSPIRTLEELSVVEVASTPYFPSYIERNQLGKDSYGSLAAQEFGTRRRHRCLVVTARSRSFLYHQVRLLVGVLKSVGTRELTVPDVERILKAKTVTAASPMAPACGLYLGQFEPRKPAASMDDYHSKVDTSRPIRSVKEALAIFGEKVLIAETYDPKQSTSPDRESAYYSPGSQRSTTYGDDQMFDDAVKKLEAELWETKMELKMLEGRESETEEAVFSSNRELPKHMSSVALENEAAAAKGAAMEDSKEEDMRDLPERTRASAHAESILKKEDVLESKKKKKNVMKKHIILLVGSLFLRKKRSSTTNIRIEDKAAVIHPTDKK